MARIRYLKPDFFKDEDLAEHPYWIRLLFQGLWNIADKEGRLEDRVKRIKVDVFPYDNIDIEKGLQGLSKPKNGNRKPFIQRYDINGDKYIQIVNWHKHQKPHHTEQESKIPPAPPLIMEKGMEKQDEASKELRNGVTTVKKPLIDDFFRYFLLKTKKDFKLTSAAKDLISQRLKDGYTLEQMKLAVDNFVQDDWPERQKHLDLIYCIGKQKGKPDNLEKWLNAKPKKIVPKAESNCPNCQGTGIIKEGHYKGAQCLCVK